MLAKSVCSIGTSLVCLFVVGPASGEWRPPARISPDEILNVSNQLLAQRDTPFEVREDVVRIQVVGMLWQIGAQVYQPSTVTVGPDGKPIGVFILHGGNGDHRDMDRVARLAAGKFGFKVVSMTYPGRLYLLDPSRDWPGDTIRSDGSVRTPIWDREGLIGPDQYEVIEDRSMRNRYGTLIFACAKEGTEFYHRMAGWPAAFEEGAKELMRRNFPDEAYSIYIHGLSTGGPFSFMLSQRVSNIVGVLGMENTPFGYVYSQQINQTWEYPFHCLNIRTWRDSARIVAWEAIKEDGDDAMLHFPRWIERVFEHWEGTTHLPGFKAEYPIHLNGTAALRAAAEATATHLKFGEADTARLVERYVGYTRELKGPNVKPVPPILFGLAKVSTDHTLDRYQRIVLPAFAAMDPPPKVDVVQFELGTHMYSDSEEGLPMGIAPAVVKLWNDAILQGYYHSN